MITNGKFLSHIPPVVTPPQNHKNGFLGKNLQNQNRKIRGFRSKTGKPWILMWSEPDQTWARILGFWVRCGFFTIPENCKIINKNFINLLFSTDPFLLVNAQSGTDWIKFNVGQYGFYRVNYPESEWAQFAQLLMKSHEVNRIFQRKVTTMVFLIVRVQWI